MAHHTYLVEGYDKATDKKMTKTVEAASEEEAIKLSGLYVKTLERVSGHGAKKEAVIRAPKTKSKKKTKKKAGKAPSSASNLPLMLGMGVACVSVVAIGVAVGLPLGEESEAAADQPVPIVEIKVSPISAGTTTAEVEALLGKPDQIKPVASSPAFPASCWVYGNVNLYFGGEGVRTVVTHWEGDLEGLIERRADR